MSQQKFNHPEIEPLQFTKDDYLHLWEYFEDRADRLKDRLWTMATWLLGFNSVILGFIGSQVISIELVVITVRAPSFMIALVLVGCILCLYTLLLIKDYDKHIQRNWNRAGVLKAKLPLVREAWAGKSVTRAKPKHKQLVRLNRPAVYLYVFTAGYLMLFMIIGVITLINW